MQQAVPRIARAVPKGTISRPEQGIPVLAFLHWYDGRDTEVPAIAVAWTRNAVEIEWEAPAVGTRRDWVAAEDIRRSYDQPRRSSLRLPRGTGQRRAGGW